jgi:hypothetical protein
MEEDPTIDEDSFDEDHSGRACSSTDGNSAVNATLKEQETIAKDKDRAVFCLRLLVIGVLVASMVGVACAVHYYISKSENSQFEESFSDDANKVWLKAWLKTWLKAWLKTWLKAWLKALLKALL